MLTDGHLQIRKERRSGQDRRHIWRGQERRSYSPNTDPRNSMEGGVGQNA